jgi:hypothetical protein
MAEGIVTVTLVAGFDIYRKRKFNRGLIEHRGGNPDAPFQGDVIKEMYDEVVDLVNFCDEAARQRALPPERIAVIDNYARAILMHIALGLEEVPFEEHNGSFFGEV